MCAATGLLLAFAAGLPTGGSDSLSGIEHAVVYASPEHFCGWPANSGHWCFPDGEVVVGFIRAAYDPNQSPHRVRPPHRVVFASTRDGGAIWQVFEPQGFPPEQRLDLTQLREPLDFQAPGFMLRVIGTHYHGAAEPRGAFVFSTDRGRSWLGPYAFKVAGLPPELEPGKARWTPRTDVVVLGPHEALFTCSAQNDGLWASDRCFAVHTDNGGLSFRFLGWIVPPEDPHRGVMPSTVQVRSGEFVTAVRRRLINGEKCWIDCYASSDGGRSWGFRGRVAYTGVANGNPPALALLPDGTLACVFADRSRRKLLVRYSADGGRTWDEETVLRSNPSSHDIGYPRLAVLEDGSLLAVYYWATEERPQQYVASTRWWPRRCPRYSVSRGIRILRVSTGQPYELDVADAGVFTHIDRDYYIRWLPESLVGATLIRTLNEDDRVAAPDHVVLDLPEPLTITVAYRLGYTRLPDWLSDWEKMGLRAVTDDGHFTLHRRRFPAGRVVLGGTERDTTGSPSGWFAFAGP